MQDDIQEAAVRLEAQGFAISRAAQNLYADNKPIWFTRNGFNVLAYRQMQVAATRHGLLDILPPNEMVASWRSGFLSPEQRLQAELIMSETALRLAREQLGLDDLPGTQELNAKRDLSSLKRRPIGEEMREALSHNKLGAWLDGLAPQNADYQRVANLNMQLNTPTRYTQMDTGEKENLRRATQVSLAYMRRQPDLPEDSLMKVNVAAQEMRATINGKQLDSDVVVGKADTPTTLFVRDVENGYAQKTWYVPKGLQDTVGATTQAPGIDNPLGEAFFKTHGGSPNGTYVHGYGQKYAGAFANEVRASSNGCIRIKNIHDIMAMALAPTAAQALGYANNNELMNQIGVPGEEGRWANTELNNAKLETAQDLKIAAVFNPVFVRDGQVFSNTSDPYGWIANYRSPHAFAQPASEPDSAPTITNNAAAYTANPAI